MTSDRNFDDLAHRFEKNVYQSLKGRIRLGVLERDLREFESDLFVGERKNALNILDAGAGKAPMSLSFAAAGHNVTLVDLSVEMLKHAVAEVESKDFSNRVSVYHGSVQQFCEESKTRDDNQYDLILCHAVVEWLSDPLSVITALVERLSVGGKLSLSFYNKDGSVFKNLLRTNFKKIETQDFSGGRRSLTPSFPREIDEVKEWLSDLPLRLLCHSGIRVFHDYIFNRDDLNRDPDSLYQWELHYSRISPFRELGRYQHFLLEKTTG
ncbi:methyltransferase domain-containing protein [Sessilibacter corallicola]|uniref:tRNA 5-carboxymethoxyuridine methyltransferase n=1 Tax=Sessilibacter corallicola TaxID=2904075 RepID=A0ABQ0ADX9_9GAMM